MSDNRISVGTALEKSREKTGKSAGEVGREIGVTGVTVRKVEMGHCTVKAETLEAIALASGMDRAAADRVLVLAGHVRPELLAALLRHPERWDDVVASMK